MDQIDQPAAGGKAAQHHRAAQRLPLILRLALREFRGGLQRFTVFLLSIAPGVFAITGVGSVSIALKEGLNRKGQAILGGDISFDLAQREIGAPEREFLAAQGRLTAVALVRAMARRDDGETALVEIKAVDEAYPLTEGPQLDPQVPLPEALSMCNGVYGFVADPALVARLGLATGSQLTIGEARLEMRAVLIHEPDRLAAGVRVGPPVLVSQEALRASGLLQPGALVKWHYRLALKGSPASDAQIAALMDAAQKKFPEAGWDIRTRTKISPQFNKNLDRFTEFLTLVGFTSLIVGGVGVANAIRGFVEREQPTIATLKCLGASGTTVFALMLTQAMLVAGAGALLGAALGATLPFFAASISAALIPLPVAPAIYPPPVAEGLLYGLLIALTFSAGPLGHAHDVPAGALYRAEVEPRRTLPRLRYVLLVLAAALCLAGAAVSFAADRALALIYTAVMLAALILLRAASFLIAILAKKLPHPRNVALRLAIGNIHRPRALTTSAVLALGLGLALLVALTLIDGTISAELSQPLAGTAPAFFFLDVPSAKAGAFGDFLQSQVPDGKVELVPMLRGRIVKLNGVEASAAHPKQSVAWVLEGDRGITFADAVPEGSSIVNGSWWPKNYSGPPLVSMEAEAADGLGLAIGDQITVNVLGREITAQIASTRRVNWRSYGINFVLVFSPNSFAGAPFNDLATLAFAGGGDPTREAQLMREAALRFPSVTSIRMRDALDAVHTLLGRLAIGVRAASSVTILASVLVLAGALAAGQNTRTHDAAVLKTLGATRARLLAAYTYEFGLIGFFAALFGVAAGSAAAFGVVRYVMDLDFVWLWQEAVIASAAAIAATILLGLIGTWRILGRRPALYLREL